MENHKVYNPSVASQGVCAEASCCIPYTDNAVRPATGGNEGASDVDGDVLDGRRVGLLSEGLWRL